jgi:hypothetical protein
MRNTVWLFVCRLLVSLTFLTFFNAGSRGQGLQLKNADLVAEFGPRGLVAITDQKYGNTIHFAQDDFTLVVDGTSIDSARLTSQVKKEDGGLAYILTSNGFTIRTVYQLHEGWRFLTKRLEIVEGPTASYTLSEVQPLQLTLREPIEDSFTPATYLPQFGLSAENEMEWSSTRQYGTFLRLKKPEGLMLTVQNPFLEIVRNVQNTTIRYKPEMTWRKEWGSWASDTAVIGLYRQSGNRIPARMVYEWKAPAKANVKNGADTGEIEAYTECVRKFVLNPSPNPISVEVGWTLNDYQIDVATAQGRSEYKRVMDTASDLGIENLLYAPANHDLAYIENDVDDWNWEHVLWLGLGQKIRKGEWNVEKSPIPDTVTEMLDYAKRKRLGILAYVYPSLPFAQNSAWIVNDPRKETRNSYATLSSRDFQDFLIHELLAFRRRTGIAGYSFDYAFFNLPGSSAYSQWRGWHRVMESLREAEPGIIIDGRQTYQDYGPWSWLAGSYPHPTGNDEQAESFTPYPDLHFDRVSADRARFVNYWYKNYEFAPQEIVPGYMTHQTPRNRNIIVANGSDPKETVETVYTPFRRRDWDYLGFQYSVLSSIATGSWNNVVDMIPGRDPTEFEHFSPTDKSWIRGWLKWTVDHKELLRHTRTILGQPEMGHIDGTAAIYKNRGYVFLFNPNYKALSAEIKWDSSTGLGEGSKFVLRELYPQEGRLIGEPHNGLWKYGDILTLSLEGTSAKVLELVPASELESRILVFGVNAIDPLKRLRTSLDNGILRIDRVAGKPGTQGEVSILLQADDHLKDLQVNGKSLAFAQHGRYVSAPIKFAGAAFSHSQEIALNAEAGGSYAGTFMVPNRIQAQLAKRRALWPIPWTKEDYDTTWLAPERLLLFLQMAEPNDKMVVNAELDGAPLTLKGAYSSVRVNPGSFVGWYADVSAISVDQLHSIRLTIPELESGRFQGLFFDNVEDEFTEQLVPKRLP